MAMTYAHLALLTGERRDPVAALGLTARCVSLFKPVPHPATGPGPGNLAWLTATLGMSALEASWLEVTGQALPAQVRAYVEGSGVDDRPDGPRPERRRQGFFRR